MYMIFNTAGSKHWEVKDQPLGKLSPSQGSFHNLEPMHPATPSFAQGQRLP